MKTIIAVVFEQHQWVPEGTTIYRLTVQSKCFILLYVNDYYIVDIWGFGANDGRLS